MTATFDIKLADYNVDRSGPVLMLQVGETARVTISALASDATPAEAESYRQRASSISAQHAGASRILGTAS